jgi:putative serine protease PepD
VRSLSRLIPVLGGAIAGGLIGLVIASSNHSTHSVTTTVVQPVIRREPAAFSSGAGMSINQIFTSAGPGVVDIKVLSKGSGDSPGGLFGGGGSEEQEDEGAGVVYDTNGDLLTDEHVVANATSVKVTFDDGRQVSAKVLGSDSSTDTAVIKVDGPSSELRPIRFANSNSAQVGDPVVAIGSPFGRPETVTSGIVSQTGRLIEAPNNFMISGAIQTDAAINPGNSGGPLLNAEGEVLGLNDQIETNNQTTGGEGSSSGIGFATPGNSVVKVANEIIGGKKVQHAYLGISLNPASVGGAQIATSGSSSCPQVITPNSPAAAAGLAVGDKITALDGKPITSTDQFIADLNSYSPGQTVTLTIQRQGNTKKIQVKLGNRPLQTCAG